MHRKEKERKRKVKLEERKKRIAEVEAKKPKNRFLLEIKHGDNWTSPKLFFKNSIEFFDTRKQVNDYLARIEELRKNGEKIIEGRITDTLNDSVIASIAPSENKPEESQPIENKEVMTDEILKE